jgi:hypothetical protein
VTLLALVWLALWVVVAGFALFGAWTAYLANRE